MDRAKHEGHRARLMHQCVAFFGLLYRTDRIAKSEIAEALQMHPRTVSRWLDSFSCVMDLRLEKGIVIIERNRPNMKIDRASANHHMPRSGC